MAGEQGRRTASLVEDVRAVAAGWRWGRRPLTPRSAEPYMPPPAPKEFPTGWARTPAAIATREFVQGKLLKPLVWSQTDPKVEGLDNLDRLRAPVMFVSNHSSHLDAPLMLCSLPKAWREKTATAAAADYFFDVWWRAASTALVFNAFPIERAGSRRSTTTATGLVERGWNLLVFPEGTRSRDGWVNRFRLGAARLSLEHGLPVVPVAIRGAYAAMPRGRGWPRRGRLPISVRFGRALFPREGEDVRALSERMQGALARLWDEDRSTWWESLKREHAGETPAVTGPEAPQWRRIWESTRALPRRGAARVWSR